MQTSSRKLKIIAAAVVLVVAVLALLFYNKSRMAAKMKANEIQVAAAVTVTTVKTADVPVTFSMIGTTYGDREVTIVSETQGKVLSLPVNVGDYISAGTIIAKIDDELKKASLANAETAFEKAKNDLSRYEQLHKDASASDTQLEQMRLVCKAAEAQFITARRQFNDTKIAAPFAGTITSRMVEIGAVVGNNTPVAVLVDIATIKVKLNVAEKDVFRLKAGDRVRVTTDVYPKTEYAGTIRNISAKGDESHTYPVEVSVPNNRSYPLKAGMFVRAVFTTIDLAQGIVIPRDALVGSLRDPKVYVVRNNVAELRSISIGREVGTTLEVSGGLVSGEVVVINGQVNLRDKAPVTIQQ
ncbi:MAG: efflux RND transporter periplasmic adaptor subunit [Ignavibacteriales bacterium]|nr:efflux RND transporter periplasmic adaptor subunit [Ignavibacteriales bacterium]